MAKGSKEKTIQQQKAALAIVEEKSLDSEQYDAANPRQALFLQLYFDPKSPTWGNAKQSAIAAGYSEEYADTITYLQPKWLSEYIGRIDIASLVEKHVVEVMTLPTVTQAMGAFGPLEKTEEVTEQVGFYKNGKPKFKKKKIKTPIMVANLGIIKEKTAVMKIAAPAHNPEKYGRQEGGNKFSFTFDMRGTRERYTWNTECL